MAAFILSITTIIMERTKKESQPRAWPYIYCHSGANFQPDLFEDTPCLAVPGCNPRGVNRVSSNCRGVNMAVNHCSPSMPLILLTSSDSLTVSQESDQLSQKECALPGIGQG